MGKLTSRLKADWEIALFWGMVLALVATLGIWYTTDGRMGDSFSKGSTPPRQALIGENALAFLDTAEAPNLPRNPFAFSYRVRQRQPAQPTPPTPKPQPPTPAPKPDQTPATTPPPQPPKPQPQTEPPKPAGPTPARVLTYRGFMETASGQTVAFMTVTDPIAKRTSLEQVTLGRNIDGIEIKAFTAERLEVVGPTGDAQRIPKGGRRKIELE